MDKGSVSAWTDGISCGMDEDGSDGVVSVGRFGGMDDVGLGWFRGSEVTVGVISSSPDFEIDLGERVREDDVPSS